MRRRLSTLRELVSGVLWSRLPLTGTLGHVNVYLLEMQGGWALFDTGSNTEACREDSAARTGDGLLASFAAATGDRHSLSSGPRWAGWLVGIASAPRYK